jgi:hypothetical protein
VAGCASPYLTWHHFDPPHRGQHHDAAGMIALCLQHHKEADSGAFTHDQLRDLKIDPFLKRAGAGPAGRFNWRREQFVLAAGGGLFIRCPVFLEMAGRPIVWLSADDAGNQLLNLDVWDADGVLAFAMRDNDWVVLSEPDDLEAPPAAGSLIVRAPSKDLRVSVAFAASTAAQVEARLRRREEDSVRHLSERYEQELTRLVAERAPDSYVATYREMLERTRAEPDDRSHEVMDWIRRGWSGDDFVICEFEAQIPFPFPVHVTASRIVLPRNNVISGAVAVDCGTAIALS